jgi:acetyl-CoA carboxylase biotin carboxyl carrier protein
MDLRKIKKLIELVQESGIAELEVRDGTEAIRIAREGSAAAVTNRSIAPVRASAGTNTIEAPLAGIFYAASELGAEPFVGPGQHIDAGQVVCIIESMKMMNEIFANISGTCTAVAVTDGQAVRSGQVLFRID